MNLGTDEACVEASCVGGVGGSLDDGAAVSEDGDGVLAAAEAKEKIVAAEVAEVGVEGETFAEGGEVDGAVVLVDLDGVASAEGDVRAAFAGEMGELALGADGAVGIGVGRCLISERSMPPEALGVQRSKESKVRRRRWCWWVRIFSASVTCREAARLTAVPRMPAVSQVSTGPVGGLGKMQARQAVGL